MAEINGNEYSRDIYDKAQENVDAANQKISPELSTDDLRGVIQERSRAEKRVSDLDNKAWDEALELNKPEITPEELKSGAIYSLKHVAGESAKEGHYLRLSSYETDKIVAGWEYLDEEIKTLALASNPALAVALLDAKLNKK